MVSQTVYELIARSHRIADRMLNKRYQYHYRYVDTFYVFITAMQMLRNKGLRRWNAKWGQTYWLVFWPQTMFH